MWLAVTTLLLLSFISRSGQATTAKTLDINCMFLGYPELEYDGFDRTEVVLVKLHFVFFKYVAKGLYHSFLLPLPSFQTGDVFSLSFLFPFHLLFLPFYFPMNFLYPFALSTR